MLDMKFGCDLRLALVLPLLFYSSYAGSETWKEYTEARSSSLTTTSVTSSTSMVSIHPSSTSTFNVASTSSSTAPPPFPTSLPKKPLIFYNDEKLLYLRIEEFSIRFKGEGSGYFPEVNRSLLEGLGELASNIQHPVGSDIIFTKSYGSALQNFSLKFYLSESMVHDDDTPMWFIKYVIHSNPNVTSNRDVLFEYHSIQYTVKAPIGFVFSCDKLHIIGYDSADDGVIPTLELRNVTVQAFVDGKISEKTVSCDDQNGSVNEQTALIIGLVVGITVVIAIIVIVLSTFVMKWNKRKEYNLLD